MALSSWQKLSQEEKNAVAVANFEASGPHQVSLALGQLVEVLSENSDWFYGKVLDNGCVTSGIFPKSFVHIRKENEPRRKSTSVASVSLEQRRSLLTDDSTLSTGDEISLVSEITRVLKEWHSTIQQVYKTTNIAAIQLVLGYVEELMTWRKQILSRSLPKDRLRELRSVIASTIDYGNSRLGLDLIVRNENGKILQPEECSVMLNYTQHLSSTARINKNNRSSAQLETEKIRRDGGLCLLLDVQSFATIMKSVGEWELTFALYDTKEKRFFSDNFVVVWPKQRNSESGNKRFRAIFVDLSWKEITISMDRVLFICRVARIGPLDQKESTLKKPITINPLKAALPNHSAIEASQGWATTRTQMGVAIVDITKVFRAETDGEKERHFFMNLHVFANDENFETKLKKILHIQRDDAIEKENMENGMVTTKAHGIWVSTQLFYGTKEEVKKSSPHLFTAGTGPPLVRKMGFPEVIVRDDVRNDVYLTLVAAEFQKSSDKNVEVKVALVRENGSTVSGSIVTVTDKGPKREPSYNSLVLHHDDKPRWSETLKIDLPDEDLKAVHVRFTFKQRSSNEAKDKSERPFAVAWMRLIQDNGTVLYDGVHDLLVYRIENKKAEDSDVSYIRLPSSKADLERSGYSNYPARGSIHNGAFALSTRDSFQIRTLTCSTSLTQNVELLGLLEWESKELNLKRSLESLMRADGERTGEEVVKFLEHILDVLFMILSKTNNYDELVFDCLVFVIGLIGEHRYNSFKPVLDQYIENKFSGSMAYHKLLPILKCYVTEANQDDIRHKKSYRTIRSLEYLTKFIVRSYLLQSKIRGDTDSKNFRAKMKELLESFSSLMGQDSGHTLVCQGALLKCLPAAVPHIIKVFDQYELTQILLKMYNKLGEERLIDQRLTSLQELAKGELFADPDCRGMLLPLIMNQLGVRLDKLERLDTCGKLLLAVLERMYGKDDTAFLTNDSDLTTILDLGLRRVMQTVIPLMSGGQGKESQMFVALLIAILSEMTPQSYQEYMDSFKNDVDLLDFMMELLMIFKELVRIRIFPQDWFQMISIQNCVILKTLGYVSATLKQKFAAYTDSEYQVWEVYFHTAVAFITQKDLQLESFSSAKKAEFLKRYKDMRRECGFDLRSMWFCLTVDRKIKFVPQMVGPFLEVSLIKEQSLRESTIPIFFDMMTTEFYSDPAKRASFTEEVHLRGGQSILSGGQSKIRGHFIDFEREMITQLDSFVERGKGDQDYADQFKKIMTERCGDKGPMCEESMRFIHTVDRLLKRLFEYRDVLQRFDSTENRMSCCVSLLEFYRDIGHAELYIRYVYKLYELHRAAENYIEAGYTLKLHADQLMWSDEPVPDILVRRELHRNSRTQRELKEKLFVEIISLYDDGQLWEAAIKTAKDLQAQYETQTHEYDKVSSLCKKMSRLYDYIMKQQRAESEYFRVVFYGLGFPNFLGNKEFIFRGSAYERLSDFTARIEHLFPGAIRMQDLGTPSETIKNSDTQYLQICAVKPLESERADFRGKIVDKNIKWYYKHNEVQKFELSTRCKMEKKQSDNTSRNSVESNEFSQLWIHRRILVTSYPLPGILKWFPVTSEESYRLNPIEVAIETLKEANDSLREVIDVLKVSMANFGSSPNAQLKRITPLSGKLQGILNPAVQGGIANYEKTFFHEDFLDACDWSGTSPERLRDLIRQLKDLIADQVPLLEYGLYLHAQRPGEVDIQFHEMLVEYFKTMKEQVEAKYGKKTSLISPLGNTVNLHMRQRPQTQISHYKQHSLRGEDSESFKSVSGISRPGLHPNMTGRQTVGPCTGDKRTLTPGLRSPLSSLTYAQASLPRSMTKQAARKSQQFQENRKSVTSLGSTHSSESVGNPITLTETLTPRRPPRPESKTSNGSTTPGRNSSLSSNLTAYLNRRSDSTPNMSSPGPLSINESQNEENIGAESDANLSLISGPPVTPPPLPPRKSAVLFPEPNGVPSTDNGVTNEASDEMEVVGGGLPPKSPSPRKPPFPSFMKKDKPQPPVPTVDSEIKNEESQPFDKVLQMFQQNQ